MTLTTVDFPDPRHFRDPAAAPPPAAGWYELAAAGLHATTGARIVREERALTDDLWAVAHTDPGALADAITNPPSPAIGRFLWRLLDRAWRDDGAGAVAGLVVAPFALPVVIAAALTGDADDIVLPGVLADPAAVVSHLREGGGLAGNRSFAVAGALVGIAALDIDCWPHWLALRHWPEAGEPELGQRHSDWLTPTPIPLLPGSEGVHLRFLVGTALAAAGADLFGAAQPGAWGVPLTRELSRQLLREGTSVLALPRVPSPPLAAQYRGFVAQREVSAQLFASNAIRRLRAAVGEPAAVLSAHRAPDAPGGGELRLSLSSPFEARDAEGFRCPLHAIERVGEVAAMLLGLLRDCRVQDIRQVAGVHPDRVEGSTLRLLFKPETIPGGDRALLQ